MIHTNISSDSNIGRNQSFNDQFLSLLFGSYMPIPTVCSCLIIARCAASLVITQAG